jgi:hypothetical protein
MDHHLSLAYDRLDLRLSTIHTHGRVPTPMSSAPLEYPKCSMISIWHCGRPDCVHPSYVDAQKHIYLDRKLENERTH